MSKLNKVWVACAALALLVSAIGVIWSKYQARTLFVEWQRLQNERDRLDIEWGQLKLEQSAAATPGRVEQIAHTQLQMTIPQPTEVIAIRLAQP